MSASESKKQLDSKRDKENWQHITFKARVGAKARIAEAAEAVGLTPNGFIRDAVSRAVMDAICKPLEPTPDEAAKVMYLRILDAELNKKCTFGTMILVPFLLPKDFKNVLWEHLSDIDEKTNPLCQNISLVLSANLPPKTKGKAIRSIEDETHEKMREIISDLYLEFASLGADCMKEYFQCNL